MKHVEKITLGLMTLILICAFCFAGCNEVTTTNDKKQSQVQSQEETKTNPEDAQKQENKTEEPKPTTDEASNKVEEKPKVSLDSITAIGDSVMLGAAPEIKKVLPQCIVDAKECRQVAGTEEVINSLIGQGSLGDTVIIALGTNGPFNEASGQKVIDSIGKDRAIFWMKMYGRDAYWQKDTNSMIEKMAEKNSNVYIIDWPKTAEAHSEWFYDDGIHINADGQKAYADLILNSLKEK